MSGGKEKGLERSTALSSLPLTGSLGIGFCLNIPIDIQVSDQVGGSPLSLWFVFRKQHVRDDGKDGEHTDSIIISALFRNTTLIAEILPMHLSVKFRIKKLHYS